MSGISSARALLKREQGETQVQGEGPGAALPVHMGMLHILAQRMALPQKLCFWICAVSHLSSTKQNASALALAERSL